MKAYGDEVTCFRVLDPDDFLPRALSPLTATYHGNDQRHILILVSCVCPVHLCCAFCSFARTCVFDTLALRQA